MIIWMVGHNDCIRSKIIHRADVYCRVFMKIRVLIIIRVNRVSSNRLKSNKRVEFYGGKYFWKIIAI